MRIHLILPNDLNHQSLFSGGVLLSELYQNSLMSYAYQKFEPAYCRLWNGLINHVESTRNF